MARKATAPGRDPLAGFFRPQLVEPDAAFQDGTVAPAHGIHLVAIEQVVPDPGQPRKDWAYSEGDRQLAELTASVREFGILQPLLVREDGVLEDQRIQYMLVAGARRHTAALRAGLTEIPVVVRDAPTAQIRLLQLVENLHRQDLAPLDEARAFEELLTLERTSPQGLATKLCISGQHIRDRLRLLADQVLADAVQRRQISATAAREIMKLPDAEVAVFRTRVTNGEVLQTNDVAVARARLAAEGALPERRSGRTARPHIGPLPEPAIVPLFQTSFEKVESPTAIVDTAREYTATEPVVLAPPATPHIDPQDPSRAVVPDLLATVTEPVLREIARVLRVGATAGWSCAELLQYLGLPRDDA